MKTRAAILVEPKKPLVVDEIELPQQLGVGQVLVKNLYTTICGAQLNEIDAVKGPDKFLPHLLGHEACGYVLEVGEGVKTVEPGFIVVLHWRPGAGRQSEVPHYRWKGNKLNAGWVTTFQEHAVVSENRVTRIPGDFDKKLAPLLGCAVTTAMGVVNNDARVKEGDSVVVFGVGGVGLNVVRFASLAGARPIIAVDRRSDAVMMAGRQGATHLILVTDRLDLKALIRHTLPRGADCVVEATGKEHLSRLGFALTRKGGFFVGVGVPEPSKPRDGLDLIHRDRMNLLGKPTLHHGKVILQSHGGGCHPDKDIPEIVRMMEEGRISLEGQITHTFSLDKINDAFSLMRSGACGRVLIDMGHEVKNTVQERKVCDFDQPIGF